MPREYSDRSDRYTLFGEFQPLVQRLMRQYGEEPELREDLVGEIYCRFCAVLDAFDPARGVPLRPYVVRQLANSVYSFARLQWRLARRSIPLEPDSPCIEAHGPKEPSADWDHALMVQSVQEGLPFAIAQLSSRQRQIVIWRYYESRSFEEIAELMAVRPATARSTLRHALRNMRWKLLEAKRTYV